MSGIVGLLSHRAIINALLFLIKFFRSSFGSEFSSFPELYRDSSLIFQASTGCFCGFPDGLQRGLVRIRLTGGRLTLFASPATVNFVGRKLK